MSGEQVVQEVYAAAGDVRDGKLSEEELLQKLEDAAPLLDDRQQHVVEGILNSKLDADVAEEAVAALNKGKAAAAQGQ